MTLITFTCAPVAVSASVHLLSISAAANRPIRIKEVTCSTDGVDSTDVPLEFRINRNADTGTGSVLAAVGWDERDGSTPAVSALEVITVDPSVTSIQKRFYVPCYQSTLIYVPPTELIVTGFLSLSVTGTPGTPINMVATILLEE